MNRSRWCLIAVILCGLLASSAVAQRFRGRGRGRSRDPRVDRGGVPSWEMDQEFPTDVFTFARVRYDSWRGWSWSTDYPDSDLNFSYRLQELTSLRVHPNGVVLSLGDEDLFDHPFLYMLETGGLQFSQREVDRLRAYLLRGGFLMVDDFWGQDEWENFYIQMKRVFPDREPEELDISHPIFHCVYDLKEKPQVPSIGHAMNGLHFEPRRGDDDGRTPHYRAIKDDKGRIMVMICHNTDLGDGWEREGMNEWYFREYSEKRAYPMGINIVFYAMTH